MKTGSAWWIAAGIAALVVPGAAREGDLAIEDPLFREPILEPHAIPQFVTPLPNPLDPAFVRKPDLERVPGAAYYLISAREIAQQVLPDGFPATRVWAYGDPAAPDSFSYPGHTLEARSTLAAVDGSGQGRPVHVEYRSDELPTEHLLPIDPTLHCGPGADRCQPEVRTVAHLHGGHVRPESDGHPEAWRSPDGTEGPQFRAGPFVYPNDQEGTTLWFHDHALGVTRLNVYAGLAAFYILRDDREQALQDANRIPRAPYEIGLAIQDRTFHPDGSLAYPDVPAEGAEDDAPSVEPEFFGNVILVNGRTWPVLQVEPRPYRFRILNGSNSRFYDLSLGRGVVFQQIGSDGGFLDRPVRRERIVLGPAERADVVVDFSSVAGEQLVLRNRARSPFPGGDPPDPQTTASVLAIRVVKPLDRSVPKAELPAELLETPRPALEPDAPPRQVALYEGEDDRGRILPMLGTPAAGPLDWDDEITERPRLGTTEVWEIVNTTADAHPIHLHLVQFRVLSRQRFDVHRFVPGDPGSLRLLGPSRPPAPEETGPKDTVKAFPGEVTRVVARFDIAGEYMWHCHILEHEDHEMMRRYEVVP